jgi:hypothetical protein
MEPLSGYAIIPDGSSEPVAVFFDLADALAWGLARIGSNRFRIRGVALRPADRPSLHPAA